MTSIASMLFGPGAAQTTARALRERMPVSNLAERVLRGFCWSVAGTVLARGLAFLASILVARFLGKEEFGALGMVQSTVGMFGAVAGLGLGTTATKYVAEYRSTNPERAGRVIRLSRYVSWCTSALMTLGLVFGSSWLAVHSLNAPQLTAPLRAASLLILFGGINGAQTGAMAGFEAFKAIAKISTIAGLLNFPMLTLAALWFGLSGAVWALVLNLAVNCGLNYVVLRTEMRRHGIPYAPSHTLQELPLVWKFSVPVTLTSLLIGPANWASTALLASLPGGYAGLGEFSAANQCRTIVIMLPAMLAGVAMPTLSNLHGLSDMRGFRSILFLNLLATGAIAGVASAGVALFAPAIAASYGKSFTTAVPVIRWMVVSGFLIAINSLAALVLESLGRPWTGLAFCLLCSISLISGAHILVPSQGAYGLALANTIAYGLHTLWQGAYIFRIVRPAK